MTDAATLALQDQCDRANADAQLVEASVSAALGYLFRRRDTMGPYTRWIHGTMSAFAKAGKLRQCEHLQLQAPRVAFWLALEPTQLNCGDCALTVRQGEEAAPCDRCSTVPAATLNGYLVPSRVLGPGQAGPALLLRYALCGPCQAKEDA